MRILAFVLFNIISIPAGGASIIDKLCSSYAVSEDVLRASPSTQDYLKLLYYLEEQGKLTDAQCERIINSETVVPPYLDAEVDSSLLAFQGKFEELIQSTDLDWS